MTGLFNSSSAVLFQRIKFSVLILSLATVTSCSRSCKSGGNQALNDDLDLFAADTSFVSVINVQKLAQSHLGSKAKDLQDQDPSAKQQYDEFVKKCGIDPGKQIDVIINAFPSNFEREAEDSTMIVRGKFAEKDILGCLDAYKNVGIQHTSFELHGYTVHEVTYLTNKKIYFSLPAGRDLVIIGKRNRVEQSLTVRDKKANSAKTNQALGHLMERASSGDAAIWGGGIISPEQGIKIKNATIRALNLDLSLKSISWSVISKENAEFKLQLDVGSADEAKKAMDTMNQKLDELKKLPHVQLMGMTTFLNLVKTETKNESILVDINISQSQTDDLMTRLLALVGKVF